MYMAIVYNMLKFAETIDLFAQLLIKSLTCASRKIKLFRQKQMAHH